MKEQVKDGGPAFPVYEFRPLPNYFRGEVRRYADGAWIVDDGEHDLAFIGRSESFAPICLMVGLPYQKNIIAQWTTGGWHAHEKRHQGGNAWHYALRGRAKTWGGEWSRDSHPNTRAGRSGMDKMCSQFRCANGRSVEFHLTDKHIAAGLLRERETKQVFAFPTNMKCMYCGDSAAEYMLAAREATP